MNSEEAQSVYITGASGGIGLALVHQYLSDTQWQVIAITRRAGEGLHRLKKAEPTRLIILERDITIADHRQAIAAEAIHLNPASVFIHNAGKLLFKSFDAIEAAELQEVYEVNVFAPFLLIQRMLPHLRNTHHIFISSVGGVQGSLKYGGLSAYSSSKGALNILGEMLATELGHSGMRFNVLALGSVDTPMFRDAFPEGKAATDPATMARFIVQFSRGGGAVANGQIFSLTSGNP